jgi:transcriptional regulator with XRE-family HTH domain
METVLEKNIRNLLTAKNLSVAELSRLSGVPYRTLQDILALKQATRITTVAAIAKGLGVPPGRLLEDPSAMEQSAQREKTREELFATLVEKAVHLDKQGLAMVIAAIDSGLADGDSDGEPLSRLENDK